MKQAFRFLCPWFFFILGACNKEPGYHTTEYKEIKIEDISADIRVPSKLWDLLEFKEPSTERKAEGAGHESAKKEEGKEENKEAGSKNLEVSFAEVTVLLVEKNPGVLKDPAIKISLPKGGGEVDLSQYVSDRQGSFYVGFDFPEFNESLAQKVLFQSKTRKRRIDDQILGAGCNQFLDVTSAFMKAMAKEGLKLNTTRDRHITVLGGTFFFAAKKATGLSVAQVTFKDSAHQNFFCEVP